MTLNELLFFSVFSNIYLRGIILNGDGKSKCIDRIHRYHHWQTAEQMLSHGHVGLLIDKLKRGIYVPFSKKSIQLICEKVTRLDQFKYLYQILSSDFIAQDLVSSACKGGNVDIVTILLDQTEPCVLPTTGSYKSIVYGRKQVLDLLLNRGISDNQIYTSWIEERIELIETVEWVKTHRLYPKIKKEIDKIEEEFIPPLKSKINTFIERHPTRSDDKEYIQRYLSTCWFKLSIEFEDSNLDIMKLLASSGNNYLHELTKYLKMYQVDPMVMESIHNKLMLGDGRIVSYLIQRFDNNDDQDALPLAKLFLHEGFKPADNIALPMRKEMYDLIREMNPVWFNQNVNQLRYYDYGKTKPLETAFDNEDIPTMERLMSSKDGDGWKTEDFSFINRCNRCYHRSIQPFTKYLDQYINGKSIYECINDDIRKEIFKTVARTCSKPLFEIYVQSGEHTLLIQQLVMAQGDLTSLEFLKFIHQKYPGWRLYIMDNPSILSRSIIMMQYMIETDQKTIIPLLNSMIHLREFTMLGRLSNKNQDMRLVYHAANLQSLIIEIFYRKNHSLLLEIYESGYIINPNQISHYAIIEKIPEFKSIYIKVKDKYNQLYNGEKEKEKELKKKKKKKKKFTFKLSNIFNKKKKENDDGDGDIFDGYDGHWV